MLVVPKEGASIDPQALLASYAGQVPKWWLPDAVLVVPELPHTATGKLNKLALRTQYGQHLMQNAGRVIELFLRPCGSIIASFFRSISMKSIVALAIAFSVGSAALPVVANAAGCASGAAVGGVAGHMAGKHGVLGAAAGCAVGHHENNKNKSAAAAATPAAAPAH